MKHAVAAFAAFFFLSLLVSAASGAAAATASPKTVTGIPLDAKWKVTIYHLARTKFLHPAWGWQHCERNYQVAMRLAKGDGLKVDPDVLFAASFLHDMAAFPPYAKAGVEHGDRAAQTSEAVLRDAGFPMSKFAAVQAAERGHMYYSNPGVVPEAIVLHDADSLDYLGSIGAARMIALTGEKARDFGAALSALRAMLHDIPSRLRTKTGRRLGAQRAAELQTFLDDLHTETFDGNAT